MGTNSDAAERFQDAISDAVNEYIYKHGVAPDAIVCSLDAWQLLRRSRIWQGCGVVPDPTMAAMDCYVVGQHARISVNTRHDGLRVVCRIEIPGIERDGGREVGLTANQTARLLHAVSGAWPSVSMKGAWPGTIEFVVDTRHDGLRVVCRIEIPGIERDGGREVGLTANQTARLLHAVSGAWPSVSMKGAWPGTIEFVVDAGEKVAE